MPKKLVNETKPENRDALIKIPFGAFNDLINEWLLSTRISRDSITINAAQRTASQITSKIVLERGIDKDNVHDVVIEIATKIQDQFVFVEPQIALEISAEAVLEKLNFAVKIKPKKLVFDWKPKPVTVEKKSGDGGEA